MTLASAQYQTILSRGMSAGNVDLWFGDSWPIGTELGTLESLKSIDKNIYPYARLGDDPTLAFSHHVSEFRQHEILNLARGGSSLDFALYNLMSFCRNKHNPNINYTAFLCLSEQGRAFGMSGLLNKHFHFTAGRKSKFDLYMYDSIIALNSFYLICKNYNIELKILPVFSNFTFPISLNHINFIEESNWICKESITYLTFGEHMRNADGEVDFDKDWIKPNKQHANAAGHKLIADKIINLLTT